jgi:hypothetical protein
MCIRIYTNMYMYSYSYFTFKKMSVAGSHAAVSFNAVRYVYLCIDTERDVYIHVCRYR